MAKIKRNIVMEGMSGAIGDKQLVFKTYSYGTVVTKFPDMSGVILSDKQKEEKSKFKKAVAYAAEQFADPVKKAALQKRTPEGKRAFNYAISEFLKTLKDSEA